MPVADGLHPIVADRIYKKPLSYVKAMSIITEGAGKHFDPVVVEAFCRISEELYKNRTVLNKKHDQSGEGAPHPAQAS